MKWRSVDELPKIDGIYKVLITRKEVGFVLIDRSWDNQKWSGSVFPVLSWLDPEVPDELLKPKEPEKKPCPWCKCTNWIIDSDTFECHFWYDCKTEGCTSGPTMPTVEEAEAAIFERVR